MTRGTSASAWCPDADLFRALRKDRATIVTDTIETFTEDGIRLGSGAELPADIVITATGLKLQALGGAEVVVDGREVELSETVGYKGMMFSGVPNAAVTLGYTNASWTLKCDLVCDYVCRLLNHMDDHGYARGARRSSPARPWTASRSSTSPRATSCARSTRSPSRAAAGRGACTRATRATS